MPDHEYRRAALVTKVFTPPLRLAAKLFLDLEVSGSEHVPSKGGLVVAANHFSHIDPPVVTIAVGRDIRFIALDDLFGRGALFDRFTLFFGAIPTDRDGAPLGPLREAIGHVAAGGTVGFFPEGRRETYWGGDRAEARRRLAGVDDRCPAAAGRCSWDRAAAEPVLRGDAPSVAAGMGRRTAAMGRLCRLRRPGGRYDQSVEGSDRRPSG